MELPKNTFYKKTLDEDQQKLFDAIKTWFEGQERCEVCQLTKNYRGWLSTYADMLEE